MNKRDKNKKQQRTILTRKGVMLIALLAVMILVINIITASYSWFTPITSTGKTGLQYTSDSAGRSENFKTLTTLKGTKSTTYVEGQKFKNQITYSSESIPTTLTAGTTYYFKTQITNQDENYGSDISLYIKNMPAGTVAVTYPSNTVRTVTSSQPDYPIIRNAYVKQYVETDVNGPGLLEVEWFITPSANVSNFSFSGNNQLYLMYN